MTNDISRFPVPELDALPDDVRQKILDVQQKAGFVPNVFLTLAHRPDEFRAFFAYHDATLLRESGLTKGEKEMIIVATSGANHCLYCVVAHGALLRVYEKRSTLSDQVAVNYRKADITARQRQMLDFAMKVCLDSAAVGDQDFAALRAHGFTDEDAWDIGAITALFGLSNRMANLTSMQPNDEFQMLGRGARTGPSAQEPASTSSLPDPNPSPAKRSFSHVGNFTDYMQVVFDQVCQRMKPPMKILNLPAGNGMLGERLRNAGFDVVQADINAERPDYAHVDMERPLVFGAASFDAVLCLEGIEHVIGQPQLLAELARVTRPGGLIVISTPNVSNLYSRLSFLFGGHFFQFDPRGFRFAPKAALIDKRHIAPISIYHLAYMMAAHGARLAHACGDRYKKKVLAPLALLLWPFVALRERRLERDLPAGMRAEGGPSSGLFFNRDTFMSRSLVTVFRKDGSPGAATSIA